MTFNNAPVTDGLVIFQNEHLAVGFTNVGTDVQDLYLGSLRGIGIDPASGIPASVSSLLKTTRKLLVNSSYRLLQTVIR